MNLRNIEKTALFITIIGGIDLFILGISGKDVIALPFNWLGHFMGENTSMTPAVRIVQTFIGICAIYTASFFPNLRKTMKIYREDHERTKASPIHKV